MPPKRSHKYVSSGIGRKRNHSQPVYQKTVPKVFVEWKIPSDLVVSPRQWVLMSSSLCNKGALSPEKAPGNVIFKLPYLTITVNSKEKFSQFRRDALVTPLSTEYNVQYIGSKAGNATCTISER